MLSTNSQKEDDQGQPLHVLTDTDAAAVMASLDRPAHVTPKSERAAHAFAKRVQHAD